MSSKKQFPIFFNKEKNIETHRSTTLKQRVILVQGPC